MAIYTTNASGVPERKDGGGTGSGITRIQDASDYPAGTDLAALVRGTDGAVTAVDIGRGTSDNNLATIASIRTDNNIVQGQWRFDNIVDMIGPGADRALLEMHKGGGAATGTQAEIVGLGVNTAGNATVAYGGVLVNADNIQDNTWQGGVDLFVRNGATTQHKVLEADSSGVEITGNLTVNGKSVIHDDEGNLIHTPQTIPVTNGIAPTNVRVSNHYTIPSTNDIVLSNGAANTGIITFSTVAETALGLTTGTISNPVITYATNFTFIGNVTTTWRIQGDATYDASTGELTFTSAQWDTVDTVGDASIRSFANAGRQPSPDSTFVLSFGEVISQAPDHYVDSPLSVTNGTDVQYKGAEILSLVDEELALRIDSFGTIDTDFDFTSITFNVTPTTSTHVTYKTIAYYVTYTNVSGVWTQRFYTVTGHSATSTPFWTVQITS